MKDVGGEILKMTAKFKMVADKMPNFKSDNLQYHLKLELTIFVYRSSYSPFRHIARIYLGYQSISKMAAKCPIFWPLKNYGPILMKPIVLGLSVISFQIVKSDLTSNSKWRPFWLHYWHLRRKGQNIINFGLRVFWRLLINMAKSDFISDPTRQPFTE